MYPTWWKRAPARVPAVAAVAAAVLVVCLAAGVAQAQSGKGDYVGRWSYSGAIGYAIPNTDEFGNAISGRIGLGYSPVPAFEIGLEVGLFSTEVSQPEVNGIPDHDIASGQIDVIPVCLVVKYHAPLPQSMATFTLLAGGGYHFVDYTMGDEPRAVFASGGGAGLPDQVVRDAWGFSAGAGLEYALAWWLSLTVEGRYIVLMPSVSGTAKDGVQLGGNLDLNTWLFTGGIKVAF